MTADDMLAEVSIAEAARGFWNFLRFKKRVSSRCACGKWPPEWPMPWPEIRRAVIDAETANKETLKQRMERERLSTHVTPQWFGHEGGAWRSELLTLDMDGPMWDEIKTWPEWTKGR